MKEGWTYKKLGEVCNIICGQDYKTVECIDGQYPIYGSGGIMGYASEYRCPANSVIIGRKGNINNPLFVETNFWNVDTAFGIVPNQSDLVPKFFYYFSKNYDFTIHDVSVTIPSLRRTDLLKITIPLPPLSVQQSIVSELDMLSGLIAKHEEQLKAYDELAQSIFYDMFGDPVENEKGWEVKKIGEVGTIITGSTPSTRDENNYCSNDYYFFKPSDIANDTISLLTESEYYISDYAYEQSRKLPIGSVLVTCIGIIGKIGILQKEATCNQQINAIKPNNHTTPLYLAYCLSGLRIMLDNIANAPVVPIINKGQFSNIQIPLPPLSLQALFAEKIEAIERQKERIRQSMEEVKTLFDSRMDYYFNSDTPLL